MRYIKVYIVGPYFCQMLELNILHAKPRVAGECI